MAKNTTRFSERVLGWFEQHGRKNLPWQQNPTPYRVWVSEIMLQQTRVQTVIPYYQQFMQSFSSISALANADLDTVLHHWSGLGYYARGRNLHKAATIIRDDYNGQFPQQRDLVEALPGIGRSTAAAILSLACGQHHAILDGNVKRVLARFHAIQGWPGTSAVLKQLWALSEAATPNKQTAAYNQAMMDLGATLCVRSKPMCEQCPLDVDCQALMQGIQAMLPSPKPRKALPVRSVRMLLLVNHDETVYLQQRPPSGIWGGLWSFPEFSLNEKLTDWCLQNGFGSVFKEETLTVIRHTFSHFHLDITPCVVRLQNPVFSVMEANQGVWYNTHKPEALGLAAPVQRLLDSLT